MKSVFSIFLLLFVANTYAQTIFPLENEWKYFKGEKAPSSGSDWSKPDFDDSDWQIANAPFRYGDGENGTVFDDMRGNYNSVYLRSTFDYANQDSLKSITVWVDYDDGFQLFLNGEIILSINAPENPIFSSFALDNHESGSLAAFQIDPQLYSFKQGTNVLAVHGLNVSTSSSDFYFDMQLGIKLFLPLAEPASIDTPSGFYDEAFTAVINAENIGDTVIYTIDGSDPRISTSTIQGITPCEVLIDPDNVARKNETPVFILQACKYQERHDLSHPVTASYIFIDKVIQQGDPGGDWPLVSEQINGQVLDFAMDPDITNSSAYKNEIRPALLDIPSVSIVTDLSHLFNPGSGIWVNALEHGIEWERPASFQIIDPKGNGTEELNCGIRIRGGYSRNDGNPKHALRVFFRDEYGKSKLKFPLFGDEGVDEFEKIDFRTSQNYSWSFNGGDGKYNIMNREVFSRDIQAQMGGLYTRSRYYHLYLNGMYWGIYQSQERSEARFSESYLGGDKDDYDVIKVKGEDRMVEATDGTTDGWEEVYNITKNGFTDYSNYYKLLGLDANGEVDPAGTCYVDIENLIDYVMVIFYTGNYDAPTNIWSNNKGVNNFYTINNRVRKRSGFVFLQHDAEHSLLYDAVNVGSGITENRVNIGFLTNSMKMTVSDFANFQPQYLHHKLMENPEYRQLFIDRVYKWFFKEKVLQKENSQKVFWARAEQIENAIVAESARWGDSKTNPPRTKDKDWNFAINQVMNDYFEERPAIVIDQIKDVNWYTSFDAPEFYRGTNLVESYYIYPESNELITLKNPDGKGELYYTLNGADPRNVGGEISNDAIKSDGNIDFTFKETTIIKCRIKNGTEWSAINELSLLANDELDDLMLSEIHYHPTETPFIRSKDLEFIEFKNIGSKSLNLSGLRIDGGIGYEFKEGTVLPSSQFVVITSNAIEFKEVHAREATGEFSGHLANSSDTLLVSNRGSEMFTIVYSDDPPWPVEADGYGNSLVYNENVTSISPAISAYWRASYQLGGTPFRDDFKTGVNDLFDPLANGFKMTVYPNPTTSQLNINYTAAVDGEIAIRLLNSFGQEIVILQDDFYHEAGDHNLSFNLTAYGVEKGMYVVQLNGYNFVKNEKIIVY